MQILEHQYIHLSNLVSYKKIINKNELLNLIDHVSSNIQNLQLSIKDKILFTTSPIKDKLNVEILIPVSEEIHECNNYNIKPIYKLTNAVVIRHEGCFSNLNKTIEELKNYIKKMSYQSITNPYCRVVRKEKNNMIIDIYIGLNCNIL